MNIKELAFKTGFAKPARGPRRGLFRGFSLIELMIVLAVVALLVALAMPGYQHFVRKANRGEAQQLLMNWANMQEIWRSTNPSYSADTADVPHPTHDRYNFTIANVSATTYTLRACASTAEQRKDKDRGVSCGDCVADIANALQITQSNAKTRAECW